MTQTSPGSTYYGSVSGGYAIQLAAFSTQWVAGEVLHAVFNDGAGGTATIDVTLTNDPGDIEDVTLVRAVRQITIASSPTGRTFIADGTTYTAPQTFDWEQGSVHTLNTASPQAGAAGTQYLFSSWSDGQSQSHNYTVGGSNATVTLNLTTQYQLTVTSAYGSPNYSGSSWHNAGASVNVAVDSTVSGGAGKQYVLTGWTGSGTGSYSGANASYNVTMNNAITETAAWKTQYQLTTAANPVAGGSVGANPNSTWYDSGTSIELTATPNSSYQFAGWSGGLTGTENPKSFNISAATTVTANFGHVVSITVTTSPTGRSFVVDGTTYTSAQTFSWVENSTKAISVVSPQAGATGVQYALTTWSPGGSTSASLNYLVPGTTQTVTANFKTQNYLTVANGGHGTASGQGWYDAGTSATFSITSPVAGATGTQYKFKDWTGTGTGAYTGTQNSNTITMNNPVTETAAWDTQYYLTVTSSHGTPQGQAWYNSGVTATASVTTPDVQGTTRYTLNAWSGAATGSTASVNVVMDAPKTVSASWLTEYYLTAAENPDAGGNMTPAPPGGWYAQDEVVNLSTTVATGYQFAGWTGSITSANQSTTVTMNAAKSVTANYNRVSQITVGSNLAGFQFIVDGTTYTSTQVFTWIVGSVHTLAAVSPQTSGDAQYIFTSWSDGGAKSHSYTVPSSNQTLTVTYVERQDATLTMERNVDTWGTTTPAPGSHVYTIGDVVHITATPEPGFKFKYWSGDVTNPGNASTTTTIDGDKTVIAVFGKQDFTLTMVVDPAEGGIVDPPAGAHSYNTNSLVELSATPNAGYRFVSWSSNVVDSLSAQTTISIYNNETVTAHFEKISYTLTVGVNPANSGTITPAVGNHSYNGGTIVNLTAVPAQGYKFVSWTGDVANPASANTTITMSGNKSIVANFEVNEFTLTIGVDPIGSGTTSPVAGVYNYTSGTVVPISATPVNGYVFANWVGDVTSAELQNTSVTMNANKTITAKFIHVGDVRITSNPEGRRVLVDGIVYKTPADFSWTAGTTHTLAVDSTIQYSGSSSRYTFKSWSDGGNQTHQITANGISVFTADFGTDYYLTTAKNPQDGGTITPSAPGAWYAKDTKAVVTATPNTASGYQFTGWSGALSGKASPDTVLMNGQKSVTANFGKLVAVTVNTLPEGLSFTVDGERYTSPYIFSWEAGSVHTLLADTLKSGSTGVRYYFNKWSDNLAREHSITVSSNITYTAEYITQFYLSTSVDPEEGGEVIPAAPGAWYTSGTTVPLQALPNAGSGYVFVEWQGSVTGTANPYSLLLDAPKTVTAYFSSGDNAAPYISQLYPANNSKNVPRNTSILFKVKDDGLGINLATLSFKVNNENIVTNGVDQSGGLATVDYSGSSCVVKYAPLNEFEENSTVVLDIQCEDLSMLVNKMNNTYTFETGKAQVTETKKDTLGIEGGIVFDDSTGIAISFPDSALTEDTEITIGIVDTYPALPEGQKGLQLAVHFGPSGLQFADSVTISIPYTQANLDSAGVSDPLFLKVFYYSASLGAWTQLKIVGADANNVYVKVVEFCYLVYGQRNVTLSKPNIPAGPVKVVYNNLYGYETSKVTALPGQSVEYRFSWGDGTHSSWSSDTTAAHKWAHVGEYGVVAYARVKTDTSNFNTSDTLWVTALTQSDVEENAQVPAQFNLSQNYPNPFNPETTIQYQVPKNVRVTMTIFNVNGQKIRTLVDEDKASGYYSVIWNGMNDYNVQCATGLYFVKMTADDYTHIVKMSFLK